MICRKTEHQLIGAIVPQRFAGSFWLWLLPTITRCGQPLKKSP
jgi:hypothetical protein